MLSAGYLSSDMVLWEHRDWGWQVLTNIIFYILITVNVTNVTWGMLSLQVVRNKSWFFVNIRTVARQGTPE